MNQEAGQTPNRIERVAGGELTLRVTLEEANLVLEGLGQLPFVRVYELVRKLQGQAQEQLGGAPPPEEVAVGNGSDGEGA